ncbi:MAG: hypothetical protein M0D57_10630 [Sphingobacteriales bacterium JAD_PAG50586_3]|nr:MAG: hypothetical protein M0D57_10630 [Sphingobacteriales bacterium JAD_PAG50586_3]
MNNEKNKKNYNKLLNTFGYDEARIEKYYPKALEPVAKLSDLNISPRTFFNWRALKAIDYEGVESDDARGWVRLNLIEVIWVRIIETFRDFGVPIKEIVRIKQLLFGNLFPQITAHSEEIIAEFEKNLKD